MSSSKEKILNLHLFNEHLPNDDDIKEGNNLKDSYEAAINQLGSDIDELSKSIDVKL